MMGCLRWVCVGIFSAWGVGLAFRQRIAHGVERDGNTVFGAVFDSQFSLGGILYPIRAKKKEIQFLQDEKCIIR